MLGKLIVSFLISASPFGECKTAIPYGLSQDLNDYAVLAFCIAGNLLAFPLFDLFMRHFGNVFIMNPKMKRFSAKWRTSTRNKTKDLVEKYGFWGLMLFVAIPLPGTGAYFGGVAAYIFGIDRVKAFTAISIGVVITCILYFLAAKGLVAGLAFFLN